MFNFDDLVGLEKQEVQHILNNMGYKKITYIENFKHDEKCDSLLATKVYLDGDVVFVVLGEFRLRIGE